MKLYSISKSHPLFQVYWRVVLCDGSAIPGIFPFSAEVQTHLSFTGWTVKSQRKLDNRDMEIKSTHGNRTKCLGSKVLYVHLYYLHRKILAASQQCQYFFHLYLNVIMKCHDMQAANIYTIKYPRPIELSMPYSSALLRVG